MYRPEHLSAYELVWRELYEQQEKKKQTDKLFWVFNPLVLKTADLLRKKYGSITINNWKSGGSLQLRGLRPEETSVGAGLSAHKFGAALDCNFRDATPEEMREDMKKLGCFKPGFRDNVSPEAECFRYIHRIENTLNGKQINWFHFDIFNCYNANGSILVLDI